MKLPSNGMLKYLTNAQTGDVESPARTPRQMSGNPTYQELAEQPSRCSLVGSGFANAPLGPLLLYDIGYVEI
jgi:hypothetical protein